jgi:hypothetical protein
MALRDSKAIIVKPSDLEYDERILKFLKIVTSLTTERPVVFCLDLAETVLLHFEQDVL